MVQVFEQIQTISKVQQFEQNYESYKANWAKEINGLFYDIMETQTGFNKTTQTYENSD